MRSLVIGAALAASLAAVATASGATPPSADAEYAQEVIIGHSPIDPGFPRYDPATWTDFGPCLDSPRRPYCLLHVLAQHGEAHALLWDLRFFGHERVLVEAGVRTAARDEFLTPQARVREAVWRALELADKVTPAQALAPVRAIGVNYSDVDLKVRVGHWGVPRAADLKLQAYAEIARIADSHADDGMDPAVVTLAKRLEAVSVQALKVGCLAREDETAHRYDCDDDRLATLLQDTGDEAGAALFERRAEAYVLPPPPPARIVTILDQTLADLNADKLDAVAAVVFSPKMLRIEAASDFGKVNAESIRDQLIEAAEKQGRKDIALPVARRIVAERLAKGPGSYFGGSDPAVDAIARWGDPAEVAALAERLDQFARPAPGGWVQNLYWVTVSFNLWRRIGRDDRAGALLDLWVPIARAKAAERVFEVPNTIRPLQKLAGRTDLVAEDSTFGPTPAQLMGRVLAQKGPNDPELRAQLAAATPERRAAALYYCATDQDHRSPTIFRACAEQVDPDAMPQDKFEDVIYAAAGLALHEPDHDSAWRTDMFDFALRLRQVAKAHGHPDSNTLNASGLIDFAIFELRERGEL